MNFFFKLKVPYKSTLANKNEFTNTNLDKRHIDCKLFKTGNIYLYLTCSVKYAHLFTLQSIFTICIDKSPGKYYHFIIPVLQLTTTRQSTWNPPIRGRRDIFWESTNHVTSRPVIGHHQDFPILGSRFSYSDFPTSFPYNLCEMSLKQ